MARTRKCYVRPPEAQSSVNQIWRLTHSPDAGSTPSVPSLPTPSRGRGHNRGALFATLRQLVSTPASQACQLLGFALGTEFVWKVALLRLRVHAGFCFSLMAKITHLGDVHGCAF